jgi:hypothetical protein
VSSKRRKGYPSETRVMRGLRIVHGDKELLERLGRNDPCPCDSGGVFKKCCMHSGRYDGSPRDHYFQLTKPRGPSGPAHLFAV